MMMDFFFVDEGISHFHLINLPDFCLSRPTLNPEPIYFTQNFSVFLNQIKIDNYSNLKLKLKLKLISKYC